MHSKSEGLYRFTPEGVAFICNAVLREMIRDNKLSVFVQYPSSSSDKITVVCSMLVKEASLSSEKRIQRTKLIPLDGPLSEILHNVIAASNAMISEIAPTAFLLNPNGDKQ